MDVWGCSGVDWVVRSSAECLSGLLLIGEVLQSEETLQSYGEGTEFKAVRVLCSSKLY